MSGFIVNREREARWAKHEAVWVRRLARREAWWRAKRKVWAAKQRALRDALKASRVALARATVRLARVEEHADDRAPSFQLRAYRRLALPGGAIFALRQDENRRVIEAALSRVQP